MFTRITVQGFKSLLDVQDVPLGRVNVFIGANGSGKSNLLEAVGLLAAAADRVTQVPVVTDEFPGGSASGPSPEAADGRVDDQDLLRRGVRLGTPGLFVSSFREAPRPEHICIRAVWSGEGADADLRYRFEAAEIGAQGWQYWQTPKRGQGTFADGRVRAILKDYAIFSPVTPVLRGVEPDITQRQPVGLAGGRLAEAVADLLTNGQGRLRSLDMEELLPLLDWVERFDVVAPSERIVSPNVPTTLKIIRFTDHWMARAANQLSAYDASEGALYVLFALVLALHHHSPRLFAIENPDQAMHPRLARAAIRLFCQQILERGPTKQVLITTHNPLILDGLDLSNDLIRLFTVERDRQGATRVDRVTPTEEILRATGQGMPLSTLWVMGRLGGAPDIF